MSTMIQIASEGWHPLPTNRQRWLLAVTTPLLFAPFWLSTPQTVLGPLSGLNGLLLTLALIASTVTDLSRCKIYNWITYTTLGWAIAINILHSWLPEFVGTIGLSSSLFSAIFCFMIMLVPYSLAKGGAGDVKLATAIAALVGLDAGILIIAFTYILAGAAILSWTVLYHGPLRLLSAMIRKSAATILPQYCVQPSLDQKRLLQQPIPLAGFFLVATLLVLFDIPVKLWSW
ncbi:MAG: A24 family peptidase [Planctomycetota bacterium]